MTKVEECARAINPEAWSAEPNYFWRGCQPKGTSLDDMKRRWWQQNAKTRAGTLRTARAVLTRLLGSVEEMDALALRCQHESGHPGDTFREIINAILQQNPSPVEPVIANSKDVE